MNTALHIQNSTSGSSSKRIRIHPTYLHKHWFRIQHFRSMRIRIRILILIQIQLSAIQLRHHHQKVRPGEHSAAYSKFNFGKQLQAYSNPSHIFTQAENNKAVFRIRIGFGSSILGQCGSGSSSKSNSRPSNSATTTNRFVQANTALHIQNSTLNKCSSKRIQIHPTIYTSRKQ